MHDREFCSQRINAARKHILPCNTEGLAHYQDLSRIIVDWNFGDTASLIGLPRARAYLLIILLTTDNCTPLRGL
jgi:hypothetical protein